jgi:hypothetical protein
MAVPALDLDALSRMPLRERERAIRRRESALVSDFAEAVRAANMVSSFRLRP